MEEYSEYEQDRLGNVNRKLDQLRAQDGNAGADADNSGILEIAGGDEDTDLVVYELPSDASQVMLDLINFHNNSGGDGTFRILEATLDSSGTITNSTRRSVLYNVSDGATRVVGYEGRPFTDDAIAVNSSVTGEIGLAVISDHKEYDEPAVEQS